MWHTRIDFKKLNPLYWIRRRRKAKKYAKAIRYYRDNPDKFCEEMLDIKLFNYQKEILREIMTDGFWCKYCGKEKSWNDKSYDVGLWLAEVVSFEALGHTEYVTPYLICSQCAEEVMKIES